MTFDLDLLTWISIGVIYSSRTIYLPTMKLLGQSVLKLSVAQGEVDWHDLWPWPLTGLSTHQGLSTYQVWSFWGKAFLSYQLHKVKGYQHTRNVWLEVYKEILLVIRTHSTCVQTLRPAHFWLQQLTVLPTKCQSKYKHRAKFSYN